MLIAAALAVGAGSDGWTAGSDHQAPLLPSMYATPPVPVARAAVDLSTPDVDAATPADIDSDSALSKQPAIGSESAGSDSAPTSPVSDALLVLEGSASWYSDALAGRRTASGEPYDPTELIAAHRALPFGTLLRVTNLANDRSVEVRVIDRGPFVAGRILDLSRSAAEEIGIIRAGHGRVRVEVLQYGG